MLFDVIVLILIYKQAAKMKKCIKYSCYLPNRSLVSRHFQRGEFEYNDEYMT